MKIKILLRILTIILFLFVLSSCGKYPGKIVTVETENYVLIDQWGELGVDDGEFNNPIGIAIGPSGYVYIADLGNNRIQKFTSDGQFVKKWSGADFYPIYIACDTWECVYVTSSDNYVWKFDSDGNFITKWGGYGTEEGKFNYPLGIAISPSNEVYVVDTYNYRIQKFTTEGTFETKWGELGVDDGEFSRPEGIAVGPSGNVHVVDGENYRIQKFTKDGTFEAKWGSHGSGAGQFNDPRGVAVDIFENIYITDNDYFHKFSSSIEFLGKWECAGLNKGWVWLAGIALDSSGKVYMCDKYNGCILIYKWQ